MNALEIKKKRKDYFMNNIQNQVDKGLINSKNLMTIISCPDDLYEDIKNEFTKQGFNVWREKFEYPDMDGYGSGEYGYNTYISL